MQLEPGSLVRYSATVPPVDLSAFVTMVTWTDRVSAPWDSLAFTVEWSPITAPAEIGDWCVLRLAKSVVSVCQVAGRSVSNAMAGSAQHTGAWTVQCVGWLQSMARAQLTSSSGLDPDTITGTMISPDDLAALSVRIGSGANVGETLQDYVQTTLGVLLPQGVFSGSPRLGDNIRVVYDADTAATYAPAGRYERRSTTGADNARIVEAVHAVQPVPTLSGGSVTQAMLGAWKGDDLLVELFPSIEENTAEDYAVGRSYATRGPRLIYRMRPWRDVPLSAWVQKAFGATATVTKIYGNAQIPEFDQITWDPSRGAFLTAADVLSWPGGSPSAETGTLFTTNWFGGEAAPVFYANSGLPIVDCALCNVRGAKVYYAYWPFFSNYGGSSNSAAPPSPATLEAQTLAIALQACQFGNYADRFWQGTIQCQTFRPDVRHGFPFTLDMGAQKLVGYVEGVTHRLVRGATVSSTTTIEYSRGLWDEALRNSADFRYLGPPVVVGGSATQSATTGGFA